MQKVYAIVVSGVVVNTIVWDGLSEWTPEEGDAFETDGSVGIGWLYDGKDFTPPPEAMPTKEELIAAAESDRQSRIDYATSRIIVWQTKLLMGRKLTDSEMAQLNSWMDYIDALAAVDTSTAPDIDWPEQPQK